MIMENNIIEEYKNLIKSINIEDIELVDLFFRKYFDLKQDMFPLNAEFGHDNCSYKIKKRSKKVLIKFPVKFIAKDKSNEKILLEIKAIYIIKYNLDINVSETVINKFIERNVSLNVHPFFRELIYNILPRAKYPQFTLPLLKI